MKYNRSKSRNPSLDIPEKANRVLNIILIALLLIVFRIWHLSVIQYEVRLEEFRKPQVRTILEPAKRATIRDRFNIPLALNKIQYNAAIVYGPLRQISPVKWELVDGKKVKKYKRKDYISKLSQLLGQELNLDPERIEDLIYSKAIFYCQVPFVLKENISEHEYYRLKMLEKDWLGIQVQRIPVRFYPKEKVASDLIGYMGAINKPEYENILQQIKSLQQYIEQIKHGEDPTDELQLSLDDAELKLNELQARAYSITDYVGKAGIEAYFEQDLRGYHGKKSFYSDAKGNFLRELPGARPPLPGQRILLTISAELQEYAEKLLIQNETIREGKISKIDSKNPFINKKQPWVKGGGIIVMDPNNGQILAMASHPRHDPNDFVFTGPQDAVNKKRIRINCWLENENYLSNLWNQKIPLERELFSYKENAYYTDKKIIDWKTYLSFILPDENTVKRKFSSLTTVYHAIDLQKNIKLLLETLNTSNLYAAFNTIYDQEPHKKYQKKNFTKEEELISNGIKDKQAIISTIKKNLDPYFKNINYNYDKVLLTDLCQLIVDCKSFDSRLIKKFGRVSLETHKQNCANLSQIQQFLKESVKEQYHEKDFKAWRKQNEKQLLKNLRDHEKKNKLPAKPYVDFFDSMENQLFNVFWEENKWELTYAFLTGKEASTIENYNLFLRQWFNELDKGAHKETEWFNAYQELKKELSLIEKDLAIRYFKTLKSYHDLTQPLYGTYRSIRGKDKQLTKHLAAAFYPLYGYGYGRSNLYRQATTQGSLFKLVTAYEALKQRYTDLNETNPHYIQLNPLNIVDQVYKSAKGLCVGYHSDGKPIPQIYKGGRLLKSAISSIGKIDVIRAIETSSNPYFSLLAGDVLHSPNDLAEAAKSFGFGSKTGINLNGEIAGKIPTDLETNRTGLYAMANGQHSLVVTPLQTCVMLASIANSGKILKPNIVLKMAGTKFPTNHLENSEVLSKEWVIKSFPTSILRKILLPPVIRNILLEGMSKVVQRQLSEGLSALSRLYKNHPEAIGDYIELQDDIIGKTSTAEKVETIDLDPYTGTNTYTHIWFGGIAFEEGTTKNKQTFLFKDRFGKPEVVVVIYLKFGTWGKEAAPLAAQMVKKWREIKKHYKAL